LVKLAAKVGSDYYPEIMGNTLIVNAPIVFSGIWSVVKGFLDEKTRKKFKIIGGGFKATLLEFIDDENIPSFLGGKCECKEHGGCMKSNVGPWNDYEITYPRGVKKRKNFHPDVNGRPIFFGADGKPILTVHEPGTKVIGHMASHMTSGIIEPNLEEFKESHEEQKGGDEFFDAEEDTTPAESLQIIQNI
jgi:hypothetical protein